MQCYLSSRTGRKKSGEVEDEERGIERHQGFIDQVNRHLQDLGDREARGRNEREEGGHEGMSVRTGLSASFPQERQGRRRMRVGEKEIERLKEREMEDESRSRKEVENCNEDEWSKSEKRGEGEIKTEEKSRACGPREIMTLKGVQ